ncbi:MAG: hypothetical protein G01um1014106_462, partial [Parcubacteria group bacterium Gr01-1014_106]
DAMIRSVHVLCVHVFVPAKQVCGGVLCAGGYALARVATVFAHRRRAIARVDV